MIKSEHLVLASPDQMEFIFIGRRITKCRNVIDAPIQVDLKENTGLQFIVI